MGKPSVGPWARSTSGSCAQGGFAVGADTRTRPACLVLTEPQRGRSAFTPPEALCALRPMRPGRGRVPEAAAGPGGAGRPRCRFPFCPACDWRRLRSCLCRRLWSLPAGPRPAPLPAEGNTCPEPGPEPGPPLR